MITARSVCSKQHLESIARFCHSSEDSSSARASVSGCCVFGLILLPGLEYNFKGADEGRTASGHNGIPQSFGGDPVIGDEPLWREDSERP